MEQKVIITKDNRPNRTKPWLVRWWGEYNPRTGKQKRYCKSFTLRKAAELFAEEKSEEFQSGLPRDQRHITLEQLCKKFLSTRKNSISKSYRTGFEQTIEQLQDYFSPNVSVQTIRQEDCEVFISNLEPAKPSHIAMGKQLSDSSISKHLRQAKTIFTTAQEWGYIRNNPFKKINIGKIRTKPWHYITVEQFNAVINKADNIREKALYGIMYWCGLRYGEAANLLWDGHNIDFEKNQINIINRSAVTDVPPFNVKDYEERYIPMNNWMVDILTKLQSQAEEKCPFVFLTIQRYEIVKQRWHNLIESGKSRDWENRYLLNNVIKRFKTRCRAAGIKTNHKLTIHCLRKSWATNLANSGKVPAHTLKELGGWSNIRTCDEYYLQSSDANRDRACSVLNELAENKDRNLNLVD